MPPSEVMQQAKEAAQQALKLDPALAEAHASLALMLSLHEWKWAEAGEHYSRALELNPGYLTAHHWYACDYLAILGRMEEAVAEATLAVDLDPISHVMSESRGYVLMLARRYEEALEQSRKVAELDPFFYKAYTGRGRTYIQMGRYAEAIRMLERGRDLAGELPPIIGALGQAHALSGDHETARKLLAQLTRISEIRHVPATTFGVLHLGLGEPERALERLEYGCERHELTIAGLNVHPVWDPLRGEPRFAQMVRRMGLVARPQGQRGQKS